MIEEFETNLRRSEENASLVKAEPKKVLNQRSTNGIVCNIFQYKIDFFFK